MRTGAIEVVDIERAFGGVRALDLAGQSLVLASGRITAVLGGNGAGKTTLFNVINGVVRADAGHVVWDGMAVEHLPAWRMCQLGMARLWQDLRGFPNLTCLENVRVAIHGQRGEGLLTALALRRTVRRERAECDAQAMDCLRSVGLASEAGDLAGNLSYGQQKLLALARLLCNEATAVLLDEPIGGLDARMAKQVAALIRQMRHPGRVVAIIEHDLRAIRDLVEDVIFLDQGRCIATGSLADVLSSADIRRRYMGMR